MGILQDLDAIDNILAEAGNEDEEATGANEQGSTLIMPQGHGLPQE